MCIVEVSPETKAIGTWRMIGLAVGSFLLLCRNIVQWYVNLTLVTLSKLSHNLACQVLEP